MKIIVHTMPRTGTHVLTRSIAKSFSIPFAIRHSVSCLPDEDSYVIGLHEVKYIQEPSRSFSVVKKGSKMDVFQENRKLQNVDTAMIFAYLNKYRKIHYEQPNYVLNEKQVDSVKKSTPFVVLTLTETNKQQTKLRMFRIKTETANTNEFGLDEYYNMDNFWCELSNGQLVKCQYFALHPILLGHIYFPMNLDKVKKGPGIE